MESRGIAEEGKGRLSSGHRPFARLQLSIWSPDAGSSSSTHLSAPCLLLLSSSAPQHVCWCSEQQPWQRGDGCL